MRFTFKKEERLKSKRLIEELFADGRIIAAHPVKLLWKEASLPAQVPVQIGVSAPKKKFKRAVDRNTIKRKMREAIRLHKAVIVEAAAVKDRQYSMMFLYTGHDIPAYSLLEEKIIHILARLNEEI